MASLTAGGINMYQAGNVGGGTRVGSTGGATTNNVSGGQSNTGNNATSNLTRAQNRNIETLNNVVNNNLTELDFSGTLRDLQGNPVPKPGGGFWDHRTEMVQSYNALQGIKNGLEGSLLNPNLEPAVRTTLQNELNRTINYINTIDLLFEPFGGVK